MDLSTGDPKARTTRHGRGNFSNLSLERELMREFIYNHMVRHIADVGPISAQAVQAWIYQQFDPHPLEAVERAIANAVRNGHIAKHDDIGDGIGRYSAA